MSTRLAPLPALVVVMALLESPVTAETPDVPPPTIAAPRPPDGWRTAAPRDEIRPTFRCDPRGGRSGTGALVISAAGRDGLHGCWVKDFPVAGGRFH